MNFEELFPAIMLGVLFGSMLLVIVLMAVVVCH
jgi:hypothetical protein